MTRVWRRGRAALGVTLAAAFLGAGGTTPALAGPQMAGDLAPGLTTRTPEPDSPDAAERALRRDAPGDVRVVDGDRGLARLVGTEGRPVPAGAFGGDPRSSAAANARDFLDRYGAALGVDDATHGLDATSTRVLEGGDRVVRFTEQRGGLPVLGGEVAVTVEADGDVLSANGETAGPGAAPLSAEVPASRAVEAAVSATARAHDLPSPELDPGAPSLMAYDPALLGAPGPSGTRPVWQVEVRATAGGPVRELVLVDARTGQVALAFDQVADVANVVCDKKGAVSTSYACNSGYARTEVSGASLVPDVNDAFDHTAATSDWYADVLGVNLRALIGSDPGDGTALRSTVRACPAGAGDCPYENAFWSGTQMVYGEGYAGADDVVAHELTHGVTQHTSDLYYYFQAGAINESMSDVFGELVDLEDGVGDDAAGVAWEMGEDLPHGAAASSGTIRDMASPSRFGQPDRMTSSRYTADLDFSHWDNGGVHTNSGVGNKAAYLIAHGATFNGRTVTGIGTTKTAHLYWRALNTLTSGSDYADLAAVLKQSCTALAAGGTAGFTSGSCASVSSAVAAVEMTRQPRTAGATAPEVAFCPTGEKPTTTLFASGMESDSRWSLSRSSGHEGWRFVTGYAHGGTRSLAGSHYDAAGTAYARTPYRRLPTSGAPALWFAHAYDLAYDGEAQAGGYVQYQLAGTTKWKDAGGFLAGPTGYTGTFHTSWGAKRAGFTKWSNGYRSSRLDLGSLRGKKVRFRFVTSSAAGGDFVGWVIDDVSLHGCRALPERPARVTARGRVDEVAVHWSKPGSGGTVHGYVVRRDRVKVATRPASARSALVPRGRQGTAHTFSVAATAKNGAPGKATSRTMRGTRLSRSVTKATLSAGGSTTLSGTLRRGSGSRMAGRTVRISSRRSGTTSWSAGTTRTTRANGTFSFRRSPTRTTEYRVQYTGSPTYLGARSARVTVRVR